MLPHMTDHHTRGRGSNLVSRANLTGPKRNAVVKELKAGQWVTIADGLTYSQAYKRAQTLEADNPNKLQPRFAATVE